MTKVLPWLSEDRILAISFINGQDVFRNEALFSFMGLDRDGHRAQRVYRLLKHLTRDGYIMGLERDQYALSKQIPQNYSP